MDMITLYIETKTNNINTAKNYRKDIELMLSFIGKSEIEITKLDLAHWKNSMSNLSSATIARRVGTVKRYFTFLYENDLIDSNPAQGLKPPTIKNKQKTPLTPDEINSIINVGKNPRDKAIVTTLISTGMRISELINIKLSDIVDDNVHIIGKGNKERLIHFNKTTMASINEYLKVRKEGCDRLFVSDKHTPMNAQSVNNTLKCLARRAGLEHPDKVHNHLCRTTNATLALQHGVPIENIKTCLGHSNIETTMRYAKIVDEANVIKQTMDIQLF